MNSTDTDPRLYSPDADEEQVLRDVFQAIEELEDQQLPELSFLLSYPDEIVAQVLESVPAAIRHFIWEVLPTERYWPVLLELQLETAKHLVDDLSDGDQLKLQQAASPQDLIALADVLPDEMVAAILLEQEVAVAEDLQQALAYTDGQMGRYINKNVIRVRPRFSIESVLERVRANKDAVAVFVISRDGEFLGHIPIAAVLRSEGGIKAQELCEPVAAFEHSDDVKDAALDPGIKESVAWYPVFRDHKLIGAVSIWTMLYELQEHSVEATINEAPSGEEDLFTPIGQAVRIRAFWLTINLFTAFLASWVIGWFEVTIQQVVALAILMPVVASMGGIAGSQTLAVALRGLTLNYLTDANLKLVLVKEARIAILNGVMLGTFVAVVVAYWFNSLALGLIILVAITINSLAAASSGTVIPFLLKKMKIDPAVSGAVILTTITDVVGFFVFLSLASLVL